VRPIVKPIEDIAQYVWQTKYRYRHGTDLVDRTIDDTWARVAGAVARAEPRDRDEWESRFCGILRDFTFLPGGRILAGAGTTHRVTLFNCFVMGVIDDSMDGIFDALKEGALTMQQGGGVGYDFSSLRPRGVPAHTTGTLASGPVSFMRIWDSMCATLLSTGARRGAMMATLRIDHPDIEEFVEAKRESHALRNFNLSILVSDAFLDAVHADEEWPLVFPAYKLDGAGGEIVMRQWSGEPAPVACRVLRRVSARELWRKILRSTYEYAEPGVLFIDRINELNNLHYRERISATNPCGEIPLPPYGACNLGSINLTRFVRSPFSAGASLDFDALEAAARTAVRFLDDVIETSSFPLEKQAAQARGTRRIGLGMTGLADTLAMLGIRYGEARGREIAAQAMRTICHAAYRSSVEIAREKGPFPFFDPTRYLEGAFVLGLPDDIRAAIAEHGIRNSHLTAIAPSGTISLLAGNVSSGIEPIHDFEGTRRLVDPEKGYRMFDVTDYAVSLYRTMKGPGPLPASFVRAGDLPAEAHIEMQAALQPYVDSAISKTINVPEETDFESFQAVYDLAYRKGLKGCTTFRPNPVTGAILAGKPEAAPQCCTAEREAD